MTLAPAGAKTAPIFTNGVVTANYLNYCHIESADEVALSLTGPFWVGGQMWAGGMHTQLIGGRARMVGCGPALQPFKMYGQKPQGLGRLVASCGGTFNANPNLGGFSTSHLVCDVTIAASRTTHGRLSIDMRLLRRTLPACFVPGSCEPPPGDGYNLVGIYMVDA
jgi:hypothetical protein